MIYPRRFGDISLQKTLPAILLSACCVAAVPSTANALTLYGGKSGTATVNWLMPTTVDPNILTIKSLTTYTTQDDGSPLTGATFEPVASTIPPNYGLQIVGDVPNKLNGLTSPVVAVQVCFGYSGTINMNSITDPNINSGTGKPYVPWSVSGYVSHGEECFLFRQQKGSADLDVGAWYAVLQGLSKDPSFSNAPVTVTGYTVPPPVPEASSAVGLLAMVCSAPILLGMRRRTVS